VYEPAVTAVLAIAIVPLEVIVPPDKPVPAVIEVTVPGFEVTVPQDVSVPLVVKYLPLLLVWLGRIALAAPVVVVAPVPPLATGKVPVTPVVRLKSPSALKFEPPLARLLACVII
jgi:hypothetical protein